MIKNYLKIAFRNIWKHRSHSAINILGLAIGMASVMLILLYVRSETSVDKFHTNLDSIYRVNIRTTNPRTAEVNDYARSPYRLASELAVDYPEWELVRFISSGTEEIIVDNESYNEDQFTFADDGVFEVFSFKLLEGDASTVLKDPFSVVMSTTAATKYFGGDHAVGKVIQIRDLDFVVTGVMEDIPDASQFEFDVIASMNSPDQLFSRIVLENWGEMAAWTFTMLESGADPKSYTAGLQQFTDAKLTDWAAMNPELKLQPMGDVYLKSADIGGFMPGGDIVYVYAFSSIAAFILLIACINYINLSTARSSLRSREVGLRKVVGASRQQLFGQFMSESILLAIISLIVGLGLAALALPFFNELSGKAMDFADIYTSGMVVWLLGITALVGLVAGLYPAAVLSGIKPISTLSGTLSRGVGGGNLRRVLVTFQFAVSIFLLIVTAVVYRQLVYCSDLDLGFDKEHIVILRGTPIGLRESHEQFRTELLKSPQIVNGGASSRVPPGNLSSNLRARPEGVPEDQQRGMQTVWTDFDFIETLGLELAAGRSFSRDFPADAQEGFIINEEAAKQIGWSNEEAIDKTFGSAEIKDWNDGQWENRDGRVIGVLKDFHFESLKEEIVPTVYFVAPYMAWNYVIRIRPGNIPETIAHIEDVWGKFNEDIPFEYTFADEEFAQLYENEQRQGRIFGAFAILGILIACLGLVGLASFTAERKRKELGVRKVLGASSFGLVMHLSREFTWLVGVAFVVASPIAYYVMTNWLQDFAYRIQVGFLVFVVSGLLAVLIAWITVGLQTARTAYQNPVEALRYE